ncbi:uncharacterized protein LOC110985708 [Acanthaster planci]|uniref:Uncharacterized protein LOC110985708 n=1 Tax=Acanthaster planci TaxID=133434 RepID=A0A8B7ZCB0_ACAPL|nr:uncharacterized protein LOC110985708 [Acanthaster planci]
MWASSQVHRGRIYLQGRLASRISSTSWHHFASFQNFEHDKRVDMAPSLRTPGVFQLLLMLQLTLNWIRSDVEAIRAVNPPVSTTGVVGHEAEFSCSVADKSANEILTWRLEWEGTDSPQFVHLTAGQNTTTFIVDEELFQKKHATYTTRYSVNGSIHTTVLHLDNIQTSDEGSFACVYQITIGSSIITRMIPDYGPVRLTVWIPPSPTCSYSNLESNATAHSNTTTGPTVELRCADTLGVPSPELNWRTDDRRLNAENPHVYQYELQPDDNGRWFHCEATSPATREPVICSVRPMRDAPTAEVTPKLLQLMEGAGNIEFICIGNGLPEIVSYQWFIDGSPTFTVDHRIYSNIKVTNAGTGSVLTIEYISKLGRTVVSCEVMVTAGFTGQASGSVVIYEQEKSIMYTQPVKKQAHFKVEAVKLGMKPSVYAMPLAVLFLIFILVLVLFIWSRKLKRRDEAAHRHTRKLSPSEVIANGEATKPFRAYRVTTV